MRVVRLCILFAAIFAAGCLLMVPGDSLDKGTINTCDSAGKEEWHKEVGESL